MNFREFCDKVLLGMEQQLQDMDRKTMGGTVAMYR